MTTRGLLLNADTGQTLASEARVVFGVTAQLVGLIGQRVIPPEYALGITHCDWIHSFGVLLPLDIAYCDKEGRVLRLVENLRPNRAAPRAHGAWIAWEMKSGGFSGRVREGQRLILQSPQIIKSQTEQRNV